MQRTLLAHRVHIFGTRNSNQLILSYRGKILKASADQQQVAEDKHDAFKFARDNGFTHVRFAVSGVYHLTTSVVKYFAKTSE